MMLLLSQGMSRNIQYYCHVAIVLLLWCDVQGFTAVTGFQSGVYRIRRHSFFCGRDHVAVVGRRIVTSPECRHDGMTTTTPRGGGGEFGSVCIASTSRSSSRSSTSSTTNHDDTTPNQNETTTSKTSTKIKGRKPKQSKPKQLTTRQRRPPNSNVRNIMALLQSRYPDNVIEEDIDIDTNGRPQNKTKEKISSPSSSSSSSSSWKKTRNYLYQVSDQITVEQVREVIDFLDSVVTTKGRTIINTTETETRIEIETAKMILQTTPRILRKSVTNSLRPTSNFLLELWGPSLFQEAIQRNPTLLISSGIGYGKSSIGSSRSGSGSGSGSGGEKDNEIELYLKEIIKLPSTSITSLQKSAPYIFSLSISKIEVVLDFFTSILQHGRFSKSKIPSIITKIITSSPQLLTLSVPTNLQPRVDFLQQYCGLNATDMASLLKSSSSGAAILGLSISENLYPTLEYLSQILMSDEEDEVETAPNNNNRQMENTGSNSTRMAQLRKTILLHPPLLGLSLKNLEAKVKYFNAIDHAEQQQPSSEVISLRSSSTKTTSTKASLVSRVAIRAPAVYSLSLRDNIIPTIEFLAKVWGTAAPSVHWNDTTVNMTVQSVIQSVNTKNSTTTTTHHPSPILASLLKEYPTILTLSLQGNIQPTMNFYNRTGYVKLTDDWELIPGEGSVALIRGRYIAASLYNRLLPRWHYCYSKGTLVARPKEQSGSSSFPSSSTSTSSDFAPPPLHLMVSATDESFCTIHGFDVRDFQSFKADAIPRLKFSSQFDTWLKTGRPIEV